MTTLLQTLAIGAAIGAVIGFFSGGTSASKAKVTVQLLAVQMRGLQKKLDALLQHQSIELSLPPASGLSPEVERLAKDPAQKRAAIMLYLKENPGTGLGKAGAKITAYAKGEVDLPLLAGQLQKKLDALLKHEGIELPPPASGMSPELERLACLPDTKIAAIKLYRQENPGASLREAKEKVESFYRSSRQ